jgi:hypothetical protein
VLFCTAVTATSTNAKSLHSPSNSVTISNPEHRTRPVRKTLSTGSWVLLNRRFEPHSALRLSGRQWAIRHFCLWMLHKSAMTGGGERWVARNKWQFSVAFPLGRLHICGTPPRPLPSLCISPSHWTRGRDRVPLGCPKRGLSTASGSRARSPRPERAGPGVRAVQTKIASRVSGVPTSSWPRAQAEPEEIVFSAILLCGQERFPAVERGGKCLHQLHYAFR